MGTPNWIRSSKSEGSSGVEVAVLDDEVIVREAGMRLRPALYIKLADWEAFLAGVRLGEFDVPVR